MQTQKLENTRIPKTTVELDKEDFILAMLFVFQCDEFID